MSAPMDVTRSSDKRAAAQVRTQCASLPADAVFFGEVSLSGAVRPVTQAAVRLKEAAKLGFARAFAPDSAGNEGAESGLNVTAIGALSALVADVAEKGLPARKIAQK